METSPPPVRPATFWGGMADALSRQHGHLFTWSPVCVGIGVGGYFALPVEPEIVHFAMVFVGLIATWLFVARFGKHRGTIIAIALWAVTLAGIGAGLASWRANAVSAPVLSFRYYGPVEGRVVAIDRSASEKMRLTLDQVRLNRVALGRTPRTVRISLHGLEMIKDIHPGDVVMTTGHLGPPSGPVEPGGFDFQRHLWFKQLGALGYTRNPVLRSGRWTDVRQSFGMRLYSFRLDLAAAIKSKMGGTEGPFAAAIITGDRADLDAHALQILRASNLAHLLAISGLHMGLITGAVFAVTRLLVSLATPLALRVNAKKVAAVTAFAAALIYLGVSGASIATQRAFIMVSVMLLAICLERPALSLRAVAIAALAVLVLTPEALIGPGFQMSFSATVALVAVFGNLRDTGRLMVLPKWTQGPVSLVLSSFVAGLATAPFGAAHFNQIAQYGLLANIMSVPVMGFVVMPGALVAALLSPLGLEGVGLEIMRLGLAWILGVAEFVSGLNGSTTAVVAPGPWVLPLVSIGGLILCLWRGRGRIAGLLPVLAAFYIWSGTERPDVLISDTGRLVGVMRAEGRALNKPKGDGFAARVWLENDGDKADQFEAAARQNYQSNQLQVRLGAQTLIFDASAPDKIDLASLCAENRILLVPRVSEDLPQGCFGWQEADLRRVGAIALFDTPKGLRIETARDHQGTRLWTQPLRPRKSRPPRKAPASKIVSTQLSKNE